MNSNSIQQFQGRIQHPPTPTTSAIEGVSPQQLEALFLAWKSNQAGLNSPFQHSNFSNTRSWNVPLLITVFLLGGLFGGSIFYVVGFNSAPKETIVTPQPNLHQNNPNCRIFCN